MNSILGVILLFGVLIFFHELGHFIFAKRAGILCREFALGMGPKLFSFRKGETLYTLRILPIGGFVRMAGEDPEVVEIKTGQEIGLILDQDQKVTRLIVDKTDQFPGARRVKVEEIDLEQDLFVRVSENEQEKTYAIHPKAFIVSGHQETQIAPADRQFSGKTLGQRFLTIFAGPAANLILAAVLFIVSNMVYGLPVDEPRLGVIQEDSPAAAAGLQQDDQVISIDQQPVQSFTDIREIVSDAYGQELIFTIDRDGTVMDVAVTPEEVVNEATGESEGKIGVFIPTYFSFTDSLTDGLEKTVVITGKIFEGLGMLITGGASVNDLSGPVGIFHFTEERASEGGLMALLNWGGILSINLAIFNMLPIPALDGGRMVFLGVEALRGKPIDPHKEGMVHFLGFAFLMLLILFVTWNDIQKFIIQN